MIYKLNEFDGAVDLVIQHNSYFGEKDRQHVEDTLHSCLRDLGQHPEYGAISTMGFGVVTFDGGETAHIFITGDIARPVCADTAET